MNILIHLLQAILLYAAASVLAIAVALVALILVLEPRVWDWAERMWRRVTR